MYIYMLQRRGATHGLPFAWMVSLPQCRSKAPPMHACIRTVHNQPSNNKQQGTYVQRSRQSPYHIFSHTKKGSCAEGLLPVQSKSSHTHDRKWLIACHIHAVSISTAEERLSVARPVGVIIYVLGNYGGYQLQCLSGVEFGVWKELKDPERPKTLKDPNSCVPAN
jgi:hypothetical protein